MIASQPKMKAGWVARIRVNPKDCMSVYDAIKKMGLDTQLQRISFDQAVRITLSSCLESLRQAGQLPERDGFEFNEIMSKFPPRKLGDQAAKLQFTQLLDSTEAVKALVPDHNREQRRLRYNELSLLYEGDPLNHPKPEVGTPEWLEWEKLCAEFAL